MSVPNQTPYIIYNANGLTTVFPFEFYIINSGDIQVSLNGDVLTTGYSVSGAGNVGGGDVTFLTPPANGSVVMLERVVPTYRLTDYQDNGDLLADTVNKDFDRLWMAIQRSFTYLGLALRRPLFGGPYNAEGFRIANLDNPVNPQDAATKNYVDNVSLARALRVPESYVDVLPPADQRANKLLAFNSAGKPIVVLPPSGSATDVLIELAKPTGAGIIGAEDKNGAPTTVQDELDKFYPVIDFSSKHSFVADFANQCIIGITDREGETSAIIKADAGRTDGAFPQGIAVDPVTGEFLITRGWDANTPTYVHIYDSNFNFKKVVRAGGGFSEGIVIGYVSGERRIGLSRPGTGYSVYSLPDTDTLSGLDSATLLFEQSSSNHLSQMCSYGNKVLMLLNTNSSDQYFRRGIYSVFDLYDFLTTPDPLRKSWLQFPYSQLGGAASDSISTNGAWVSKGQAVCLSPRGVGAFAGAMWNSSRDLPGNTLRFIEVGHSGEVINNQNLHPKYVLQEYADKGWTRPNGSPLDNTEAEGVCYSDRYGYVWMTVVSEVVFITTQMSAELKSAVSSNKILDFKHAVNPSGINYGSLGSVHDITAYNSIDATIMSSPDNIVDYMRAAAITEYTCTCRLPLTFGAETFSGVSTHVRFVLVDGINVIASVTEGRSKERKFYASGNAPRTWSVSPVVIGGANTPNMNGKSSVVQIGSDDFGQIRFYSINANTHTPIIFSNQTNGVIGTITMNASGVAYNQTSDERRKIKKGAPKDSVLDDIQKAVENGSIQMAIIDNEEVPRLMFMAQTLSEYFPEAVTAGGDDPKETPWTVDYSVLVPHLMYAVYLLSKK
ncbi:hypothetical protein HVY42_18920 [Escherichia coli]|nr:hypothetical protein HVY42_18920 [Escherichia coli]